MNAEQTDELAGRTLHTIAQAAQLLGCGKYTILTLHESGALEIVKLGRLTRVTDRSLRALLSRLPTKPLRATKRRKALRRRKGDSQKPRTSNE